VGIQSRWKNLHAVSAVYLDSGGQKPFREKISGLPKAFYQVFLLQGFPFGLSPGNQTNMRLKNIYKYIIIKPS